MFRFYKRKDTGYYYVDLRSIGQGQPSLKTADKRIARAKVREIEQNIAKLQRPERRVSLEEFKNEYLAHAGATKASNTERKEFYALRLFQKLFPSIRYLQDVTPRVADRFVQQMSATQFEYIRYSGKKNWKRKGDVPRGWAPTTTIKKPLSRASVNSYLAAIRSVFGTAVRWEYLKQNPFKSAPMVPEEDLPARVLTLEELGKIFASTAIVAPSFLPLWAFYLFTGTRRSEAVNLEWNEVDFNTNIITLIATKGKSKRKKKYRKILMRPHVREILLLRRHLIRPFAFHPARVTRTFVRIARDVGIPDASLHSLRSTFSSYIQQAGMPLGFVSWYIGHANEDITLKEYTGFYGDMISSYFQKFEQKLLPAIMPENRNKIVTDSAVEMAASGSNPK